MRCPRSLLRQPERRLWGSNWVLTTFAEHKCTVLTTSPTFPTFFILLIHSYANREVLLVTKSTYVEVFKFTHLIGIKFLNFQISNISISLYKSSHIYLYAWYTVQLCIIYYFYYLNTLKNIFYPEINKLNNSFS